MTEEGGVFTLSRRSTPIGQVLLLTDEKNRLRALDWEDCTTRLRLLLRRHYAQPITLIEGTSPAGVSGALDAYFAGEPDAIESLPVKTGGTVFQRAVWAALRKIPCGRTMSYRDLASSIGRPTAVRAIGLANGANPIGIVVPCHRVIGADGTLTGYAGGLHRKRWLLAHEARR
ncbi:methylated-DNA--[protein]-cysteine S-methyltransferase [Telmatospirillum siberiense]|uniref:Methylated-DNA--protein-cysteine methyltransferase n=1 Tax=Telmatospirillum siberiense TaxID=382514 RepID=A0A2N3PWR6_9PROT|nr:methylated-DNA--[protein]-cysteine S-methyltransferase [Telmatospirillum siberiense]PKU24853.1 methylated-DNA--[protein]-cysteine S-methyltransferase [Telmatospirillum siberiense]